MPQVWLFMERIMVEKVHKLRLEVLMSDLSLTDCVNWLNQLDEGATIWDTDYKFIERIVSALELLLEEESTANIEYRKWKAKQGSDA